MAKIFVFGSNEAEIKWVPIKKFRWTHLQREWKVLDTNKMYWKWEQPLFRRLEWYK